MTARGVPADTIAAIATAAGRGAIGIVRISGPEALVVAARVFRGRDPRALPGFTAARGWIEDGEDRIDEALCLVMRAPRSYTREDVAELHCHGGPALLHRVLAAVLRAGARPAEPGEFTRRAFLAGRIDLAQAEAVADLIAGETAAAARAAADQLAGGLSRRIEALRFGLAELLARLEAAIDFPEEEDVPGLEPGELLAAIARLAGGMRALLADAERGRRLREGVRVVIAGRPNVGKSTLMNALLRAERVLVSPEPGTTRDVVEDALELEGIAVRLFDTAGLRSAAVAVEARGADLAREALAGADLALLVLDGSEPIGEDDRQAAAAIAGPLLLVINKSDLPPAATDDDCAALAAGATAVRVSARTGDGLDRLERLMAAALAGEGSGETPILTNQRHAHALRRAEEALERARAAIDRRLPPELAASDLRLALASLAEITGETTADDILDLIFSRFCIGK